MNKDGTFRCFHRASNTDLIPQSATSRNFSQLARFRSGFSQKYQSIYGRPNMIDIALVKNDTAFIQPAWKANTAALNRSTTTTKEALNFSALAIPRKTATTYPTTTSTPR
jgi:hypothetical protein